MIKLAGPRLTFSAALFEQMRQFAERAYPYEGCGVLVGRPESERAVVTDVIEGRNLVADRRRDRYELDPRDIIGAERSARSRGEEVVGFYHTHPDHPARPSQFDTDRAWPGYQYVVIAVHGGQQLAATSWRLDDGVEPSRFGETDLQISGGEHRDYNPPGFVAEVT
ncbi:MAG: M67 family metallopeptidase [Candidatus Dormibacteria bacterium]